jgi:hypothetical protein
VHDSQYLGCIQKLKWLFPPFEDDESASALHDPHDYKHLMRNIEVNVVMLNGDKASVAVSRSQTITDFKQKVSDHFGIEPRKQRLIYNDDSLEVRYY